MTHHDTTSPALILPASVATKRDVANVLRELEHIDAVLTESEARQKVAAQTTADPLFSDQLIEFLHVNNVSLSGSPARQQLLQQVRHFKDTMPLIHLTFATEADSESLQQLVTWMRASLHPQTVLTVGLQPDLIGGVHIRTTNHMYDCSVRARLGDARHLITEELEAIHAGR